MPLPVAHALEDVPRSAAPIGLAVGVFDGVHRGHQAVLAEARRQAERAGGSAWALTFEPHPRQLLHPGGAPERITPPDLKREALAAHGMQGVVELPFTGELAAMAAEDFMAQLAERLPSLCAISVGSNWRFGHRAHGSISTLQACARTHGFIAAPVEPVIYDGSPVSSTRVRTALRHGHMEEAAALLGRPFALRGPVGHGRAIGRTLGFPTANVDALLDRLHPPHGVYAVRVDIAGSHEGIPAGAYIGRRPTFGNEGHPALEVYLLDFEGDLYGAALTVHVLSRLRGDQTFASPDALKHQIAEDLARARMISVAPHGL